MTHSILESVEEPFRQLAGHAWKWLAGIGATALLVGAAAVAWPGRTALVVAVLFGIYLVVSGVLNVVVGLSAPMSGMTRFLVLLGGIAAVVLGILCFRDRGESVALLGIWIGLGWIISGFGRLIAGLTHWLPGSGWSVFEGIVELIGGVVLLAFPISSTVTLVWVSGIFLAVMGVVAIVHAFQVKRLA